MSTTKFWNIANYAGSDVERDDDALFRDAFRYAEQVFFCEEGPFLHLRDKAQVAAQTGDLETLCLLAEGYGFWRGVEAQRRYTAEPIGGLSVFNDMPVRPTILADYHGQQRPEVNPPCHDLELD